MLDKLAIGPVNSTIHDENLNQLKRMGFAWPDPMGGRWGGARTTWTITTLGRDYLRELAA